MKRTSLLALFLIVTLSLSGCAPDQSEIESSMTPNPTTSTTSTPAPSATASAKPETTKATSPAKVKKQIVTIKTEKGVIEMELFPDKAPATVKRFQEKVAAKFYDGLVFFRSDEMVIQGGDPLNNGTGGGNVPSEYNDLAFKAGSVGIARAGDEKINNETQYFICKNDAQCDGLETRHYTNFGMVTKGLDVVNKIVKGDKMIQLTVSEK